MRVEQQPTASTTAAAEAADAGLREISALEAQAVAGGGVLLSERVEQQGPVANGVLLSE